MQGSFVSIRLYFPFYLPAIASIDVYDDDTDTEVKSENPKEKKSNVYKWNKFIHAKKN